MFANDLAVDLGTSSTRMYVPDRGLVLDEPSVLAINANTGDVQAIGASAMELMKQAPTQIFMVAPVQDGVVSNLDLAERMLEGFVHKTQGHGNIFRPRITIGVHAEISEVERRAIMLSACFTVPSEVHLVEQPVMAAVGAGIPVHQPHGTMIVDIGAGMTQVAVISCDGIVYSHSVRRAGNHMDNAIVDYLYRKYHLVVPRATAEQIKIEIGSAYPLRKPVLMTISGRNTIGGPEQITIDGDEVRQALDDSVLTIIDAIRSAIERTPPELLVDITDRGVVLTGGGALLTNLDLRIRDEIELPVVIADHPLLNAVLGAGKILRNSKALHKTWARFAPSTSSSLAA